MNRNRRGAAPAAVFPVVLLFALLLSACAVGPRYVRPAAEVPTGYKEGETAGDASKPPPSTTKLAPPAPGWVSAEPNDAALRGAWWKVFGDTELDALEDKVDGSNQTVQIALAQLRQARATVEIARSSFFPTVVAGAAASESLTSANILFRAQAGRTLPDYAIATSASWEPDLWGKIGHSVESSRANAQASLADLEGIRLGLHAELATDYFNLRGLDAQKDLLDRTIVAYQEALELTNNRFQGGIASQSDVAQAQTQLETTQAQDIDVGVLRAQFEHAIATLIGQPASTFSLPARPLDWSAPAIPAGLPSGLLQRRPDIAAAERRVAAANEQIGVAQGAFFPDLTLSGSVGLEASRFANLLSGPSLFWALGPQLVGTLFDGGRRRATVEVTQAQYVAGVAAYRQTVLSAFQEVEDNLAALRILQQEAAKQNEATRSAETSLQLAMNRYQTGIAGYLDVIAAQSVALSNERVQVDLARRQADASVALIKALGGGWGSP
ncbi:MAG TPA: efflux transporter outer membrane subunit [Burkholderiaceae bacterium]|jgi:NodT family efflux transporter outer membrane factor (OMF) lipoprotein|nr:efflux transporter outer membrane subunit [Burkholderiaceae bacterium]